MNEERKYLVPGRYNPSRDMFIYYETGGRNFWASSNGKIVEVCYGPLSGGCDYFDLPLSARETLLDIAFSSRKGNRTRALMKFVRENDINKKVPTPETNGLCVKFEVRAGENAYLLLADFRRAARKQGKDAADIDAVVQKAQQGNYYSLLEVLYANTY